MAFSTPPHSVQIQTTTGQLKLDCFHGMSLFLTSFLSLTGDPTAVLQCSSLASVDGETSSINHVQREQDSPRLRTLCKALCKCQPDLKQILCKPTWPRTCCLQQGITLLLINIDGNTTVRARIDFNGTLMHHHKHRHHSHRSRGILLRHRKQVSEAVREEYHLTPMDGNIQSRTVLLNGNALTVDSSGIIPSLEPVRVNSSELITVAPYSIVFVSMPNVSIPACI